MPTVARAFLADASLRGISSLLDQVTLKVRIGETRRMLRAKPAGRSVAKPEAMLSEIGKTPSSVFLGVLLVHHLYRLGLCFGQVSSLVHVVYGVEEVGVGHVGAAEHHPVLIPAAHVVLVALGEMVPRLLWCLPLQNRPQILTVHGLVLFHPEVAKNRWCDVVGRNVEVAALASPIALWAPHHEDDICQLGVERVGQLPRVAVLSQEVAVVGDDHEQGLLHYPEIVRPLDELPAHPWRRGTPWGRTSPPRPCGPVRWPGTGGPSCPPQG